MFLAIFSFICFSILHSAFFQALIFLTAAIGWIVFSAMQRAVSFYCEKLNCLHIVYYVAYQECYHSMTKMVETLYRFSF